jgi:hypothetical protein
MNAQEFENCEHEIRKIFATHVLANFADGRKLLLGTAGNLEMESCYVDGRKKYGKKQS